MKKVCNHHMWLNPLIHNPYLSDDITKGYSCEHSDRQCVKVVLSSSHNAPNHRCRLAGSRATYGEHVVVWSVRCLGIVVVMSWESLI